MRYFSYFFTCLFFCSNPAFAEWRVVPSAGEGGYISSFPTAISVGSSGYHTLGVTCGENSTVIFAHGYPASSGSSQSSIDLLVDGARYSLSATHQAADGLWIGASTPELVSGLKSGNTVSVAVPGEPEIKHSLKGSARAIDAALATCAKQGASEEMKATNIPSFPSLYATTLQEMCNGEYQIDPAAFLVGDVDDDGIDDQVFDLAGAKCRDNSIGRGAGACGINQCTIWVTLTRTGKTQSLFGLRPEIIARGFGQTVLRTLSLRPSCPNNQASCSYAWRWNGQELEVIR